MIKENTSIEQIKLLEKRIILAMVNSDIATLDELIHDSLLFNVPNGETITKQMDLANYSSGNMQIAEIAAKQQKINIFNETAIVVTEVVMNGSFSNIKIDGNYMVMRVWKQEDGNWSIIAGSCNVINS